MNRSTHRRVVAMVASCFLFSLMTGCAALRGYEKVPWMEDGVRIGTIEIHPEGAFYEYRYIDFQKRLMRFETRNALRQQIPDRPTGFNVYDEANRLTETYFQSPNGDPAMNRQGFSRARYYYGMQGSQPYHEVAHYDLSDRQVTRTDGVAYERVVYVGPDDDPDVDNDTLEVWRKEWYDISKRPVAMNVDGVVGTSAIQFAYLVGVTDLIYVTHFDRRGNVIRKAHVSGLVSSHVKSTTTYY